MIDYYILFPACNDTFYGIDCGKKCGTNCDKQNCNHTTGECIVIKQVPTCTLYHIENSTSLSTVVAMSRMNENQMVWKYNKW